MSYENNILIKSAMVSQYSANTYPIALNIPLRMLNKIIEALKSQKKDKNRNESTYPCF